LHKTIKKVTEDITDMKFNTAVSQMMIFTNHCAKEKKFSKKTAATFALIMSPYAPHAGEEIWKVTGHDSSLCNVTWPEFDEALCTDDEITMAIQIMGKTRSTITVPADISKDDFLAAAKADAKIAKYLEGKTIIKEIYIPGKICNFVAK
jgi:leucyl-tRNA synthetase